MVLGHTRQILKKTMIKRAIGVIARQWLTVVTLVAAIGALVTVVWLTGKVGDEVKSEGRNFVSVVHDAYDKIAQGEDIDMAVKVLERNEYIPVILLGPDGTAMEHRNLKMGVPDSLLTEAEVARMVDDLRNNGDSIEITVDVDIDGQSETFKQTLLYGESHIIGDARYLVIIEVIVIILIVLLVLLILTSARRRERDTIWMGLAKETAHQLGTPIQGLRGWQQLLEGGYNDSKVVAEGMASDIERLAGVAERFARVGATPELADSPIAPDLKKVVDYMQARTGGRVNVSLSAKSCENICAPHNPALLRWAVENICKNAADAIAKEGEITISLHTEGGKAIIDISDTGKGMSPATIRNIFRTGYTTKTTGWGIGLALVRRIIEEYHHGRVWVLSSKVGVGTTFRISLKKAHTATACGINDQTADNTKETK